MSERTVRLVALAIIPALGCLAVWAQQPPQIPALTMEQALKVLNDSAWARQQTATNVVEGVGSGVFGEKEIYNRYFVRFLSARPIREAYARVDQILKDYDRMPAGEKARWDEATTRALDLDTRRWIVVAVSFRSNNPQLEQSWRRETQSQTTETMKTRAYLSTSRFPQLEIAQYYPSREEAVGVKFVFPRHINGVPVVSSEDKEVVFELDAPGDTPNIRVTFPVREMVVNGQVVL